MISKTPVQDNLNNRPSTNIELPIVRIRPPSRWVTFDFRELFEFRELLYILSWRDIKIRYKQTVLGVLWIILQPLLTMVVFSLIFGRLAGLPSDGVPYPVFTFTALLPWQLFSRALTDSGVSLVNNTQLLTKVYFPRIFIPLSGILSALVDFGISLLVLIGMMVYYRIPFTVNLIFLPVFTLMAILAALAVGLWFSAINVEYRDVRYTLPFLTQFWMFITPIAYSISLIPEKWLWLYSLNPMVGVVEGFRWSILGSSSFSWNMMIFSSLVVIVFLLGGMYYFRRMEDTFADVV
jgi:lipopolysaccharide transport system permease protein